MTPPTWLLVDTGAIVWQEFHGAARREPRAAVAGLAARVAQLERQHGAVGRVVWAFDRGPYLRAAVLPEYKAKRADDEPGKAALRALLARVPDALTRLGIPNVRARLGFEADDHLAAAVHSLPAGSRAVIASRDRDLLQLVGARAVLYDPHEERSYGRAWFRAEFGGLHPAQWADVQALAGCGTDGIPGCEGVGRVTAVKFLTGQLPRHHAAHERLVRWVGSVEHARAAVLVRLPFADCPAPLFRVSPEPLPQTLPRRLLEVLDGGA